MKQIIIRVDADGQETIDLEGFHGQGCSKVFSDFADGDTPTTTNRKTEYSETTKESQGVRR